MKVNYCFLERFNNYFNRKLIRYTDLQDYEDNSQASFVPLNSDSGNPALFDFNPNDNITSEIIVNDVPFDPDYFLILDPEDESIMQRWFVLEQKRERNGQWHYFLRRDVLSDSYDEVLTAPVYVEKGIISDNTSPLLFNHESLQVNQIKKREELLYDDSYTSWLVIYLKKGVLGTNKVVNVPSYSITPDITLTTPITQWQYYAYTSADFVVANYYQYQFTCLNIAELIIERARISNSGDISMGWWFGFTASNLSTFTNPYSIAVGYKNRLTDLNTEFNNNFSYQTPSDFNNLKALVGKTIKDSNNKYYRIKLSEQITSDETLNVRTDTANSLYQLMNNIWKVESPSAENANGEAFKVLVNKTVCQIRLEELTDAEATIDFQDYKGDGTVDSSLFDILCMPYERGFQTIIRAENGTPLSPIKYIYSNQNASLDIMNSIVRQLVMDENVLDYQLLPYCPVVNMLSSSFMATYDVAEATTAGLLTKLSGTIKNFVIVAPYSNITFDIFDGYPLRFGLTNNGEFPSDNYFTKYVNDCTLLRLCSPNYNGVFEFNLAKIGGIVDSFNVDMTLKPYMPYIHVNPAFKNLYGEDFNDQRGLVCGGDFSLGAIKDAWSVYEIQNKNYQNIFDRQIQNLNVNNAINRQEAVFGAVAGTVTGGASGAMAGGMLGGGWGALAGGVIGTGTSLAGGILDYSNLEKRQTEQIRYSIDNYNLQLGNIRALPNSITRTNAITANNKLVPFVEVYECTEAEKQAYINKIKYDGMTVGVIDKMANFVSPDRENFFKGRLIRITSISEDNHYVETINEEIMKGVFI